MFPQRLTGWRVGKRMPQDQYPHLIIFVVRAGSRLLRLPIRTLGDNLSPVWMPCNEGLIIPSFVRLNFRGVPDFCAVSLDAKSQRFRLDIVQRQWLARKSCRPREPCTRDPSIGFPIRGSDLRSRFLRSRTCTSFRKGSLSNNHRHRIAEAILIRSMG